MNELTKGSDYGLCTVVSFMPVKVHEVKPGVFPSTFDFEPSDGKIPSVLHVGAGTYHVYLDQDRGSIKVIDAPDVVARAIVNDYQVSQIGIADNARPGLGWFPGKLSAAEILVVHPERVQGILASHTQWLKNICFMADNDWNRYHHHNVISDIQRRAADCLHLDPTLHEWMNIQAESGMRTCPACGSAIRPDVVVCSVCRCIIDAERYKQYQFAK